jgi:hypothetical protein
MWRLYCLCMAGNEVCINTFCECVFASNIWHRKKIKLDMASSHHFVCWAIARLIVRVYHLPQGPENSTNRCILLALLFSNGSYLGNKAFKGRYVRNFFLLLLIKCIPTIMPCSWEVSCVGRYMTYLYSMYIFLYILINRVI